MTIDLTDKYDALLARLKSEQTKLINAAALSNVLPSDGALRKIADLEVTIGAVENLIDGAPPAP